jgi:hypothetical protein
MAINYNVTFHHDHKDFVNGGGRQFNFEATATFLIEDVPVTMLPNVLTELTKGDYVIDKVIPTHTNDYDMGY